MNNGNSKSIHIATALRTALLAALTLAIALLALAGDSFETYALPEVEQAIFNYPASTEAPEEGQAPAATTSTASTATDSIATGSTATDSIAATTASPAIAAVLFQSNGAAIAEAQTLTGYAGDEYKIVPPEKIENYRYVSASRDVLDPIVYDADANNNSTILNYVLPQLTINYVDDAGIILYTETTNDLELGMEKSYTAPDTYNDLTLSDAATKAFTPTADIPQGELVFQYAQPVSVAPAPAELAIAAAPSSGVVYSNVGYLEAPPLGGEVDFGSRFDFVGSTGYDADHHNVVVVANDEKNKYGAMWAKEPLHLDHPFSTTMCFYMAHGSSSGLGATEQLGDGMTFTLHNDPRGTQAIGSEGEGLGVYGSQRYYYYTPERVKDISVVENAITIEFDLYGNKCNKGDNSDPHYIYDPVPPSDQTGWTNCAIIYPPTAPIKNPGDLLGYVEIDEDDHLNSYFFEKNSQWLKFSVSWEPGANNQPNGGVLTYTLGDVTKSLNIPDTQSVFNGDTVYWGFTGSTGDSTAILAAAIVEWPSQNKIIAAKSVTDKDGQSLDGGSAVEGAVLNYTIHVIPEEIRDDTGIGPIIVTDTLSSYLTYTGDPVQIVSNSGAATTVTPQINGMEITIDTGVSLLAMDDTLDITFAVKVNTGSMGNTVENSATVTADELDEPVETNKTTVQIIGHTVTERYREYGNTGNILSSDAVHTGIGDGAEFSPSAKITTLSKDSREFTYYGYQMGDETPQVDADRPPVPDPFTVTADTAITYLYRTTYTLRMKYHEEASPFTALQSDSSSRLRSGDSFLPASLSVSSLLYYHYYYDYTGRIKLGDDSAEAISDFTPITVTGDIVVIFLYTRGDAATLRLHIRQIAIDRQDGQPEAPVTGYYLYEAGGAQTGITSLSGMEDFTPPDYTHYIITLENNATMVNIQTIVPQFYRYAGFVATTRDIPHDPVARRTDEIELDYDFYIDYYVTVYITPNGGDGGYSWSNSTNLFGNIER